MASRIEIWREEYDKLKEEYKALTEKKYLTKGENNILYSLKSRINRITGKLSTYGREETITQITGDTWVLYFTNIKADDIPLLVAKYGPNNYQGNYEVEELKQGILINKI